MEDIMKYESVLPKDFDGTFRFTNATDEDFVGKWGSKEYLFKAKTTSPIIIHDQTPLEIQSIRKKFAKDLAVREYEKSKQFDRLKAQERNSDGSPRLNSIHMAGTYSVDDLTPYIQECLKPLQVVSAVVSEAPKLDLENKLSRDTDGDLNTKPVDGKKSLREKALAGEKF